MIFTYNGITINDPFTSAGLTTFASIVTQSVPPMTLVQGNPAEPIGRCGVPLTRERTMKEFTRNLLPL